MSDSGSKHLSIEITSSKSKIDYRNELILYFYNSMLSEITDEWQIVEKKPETPTEEKVAATISSNISIKSPDMISLDKKKSRSVSIDLGALKRKHIIKRNVHSHNSASKIKKQRKKAGKVHSGYEKEDEEAWIVNYPKQKVRILFKNGNSYKGFVCNNKFNGHGSFTWSDGTTYMGDFKNNEMSGTGKIVSSTQNVYDGRFVKNRRHGYGTYYFYGNNAMYHGEWFGGVMHGRGYQLFDLNDWYNGQWSNGYRQGHGIRRYQSGSIYDGNWFANERDGQGTALLYNNDLYIGSWKGGSRNGYGDYIWSWFFNENFTFPARNTYRGLWFNNMMHGHGLLNFGFKQGGFYLGSFHENEKYGAGALICANGNIYKGDPLFIDDKIIHVDNYNEAFFLYTSEVSSQMEMNDSASSETNSANKHYAHSDLWRKMIPECRKKYLPLNVSVHTPCDQMNLDPFLAKLMNTHYKHFTYDELWTHFKNPTELFMSCQNNNFYNDSDENVYESKNYYVRIFRGEEKNLRETIRLRLPKLNEIYQVLSKVSCEHSVSFNTWLIRIFLWQFYRNCKITEREISLIDIDNMLAEVSILSNESPYNPFEVIYFWQFLYTLLFVAWELYGEEFIHLCIPEKTTLQSVFIKFLDEDVLPNCYHFKGSVLFEYLNVLPLSTAYDWYKSMGEPLSVKTFLNFACTIENEQPPGKYKSKQTTNFPNIETGFNMIPVSDQVYFEKDKSADNEKFECFEHDFYLEKLFFLRSLGVESVFNNLKRICPAIVKGTDVVDIEYPLCFLEFYEAVLLCTQELVNKQHAADDKSNEVVEEIQTVQKETKIEENSVTIIDSRVLTAVELNVMRNKNQTLKKFKTKKPGLKTA